MKTLFKTTGRSVCTASIVFITVLLFIACSEDDKTTSVNKFSSNDNSVYSLRSQISSLESQYLDLKKQNKSLMSEISGLREKNKNVEQELEKKKTEVESLKLSNEWRTIGIALSILLIIGVPLAVVGGMLLRKTPKNIKKEQLEECPKCHWKLEQGTKVCPNPECKTRFQ